MPDHELASVRYIVDDVATSLDFYLSHLGFTELTNAAPAFADVARGHLRLLLSGPASSGARALPDGRQPIAGGWNRIHLVVDDIRGEVERLAAAGVRFRSDIISGPGGQQVVLDDPSGNPIELFQAAARTASANAQHTARTIPTAAPATAPKPFGGNVAHLARDGSMSIVAAPPGPPRRIDGYTIGAAPHIESPGPHLGEVHPDGDEFLYVVDGTMELILDDGDERAIGAETTVVLRTGDAYVVPRGVWHRLEALDTSYLIHVTPGPNGGHRPRPAAAG